MIDLSSLGSTQERSWITLSIQNEPPNHILEPRDLISEAGSTRGKGVTAAAGGGHAGHCKAQSDHRQKHEVDCFQRGRGTLA